MPGFTYGDGTGATYGDGTGSVYGTPPPRVVENLTVVDTRAEEVDLSWDAAGSATEYAVYQAESSGTDTGDYSEVATTANTSATVTGLENGEEYFFRVAGRNALTDTDATAEETEITGYRATGSSTQANPVVTITDSTATGGT